MTVATLEKANELVSNIKKFNNRIEEINKSIFILNNYKSIELVKNLKRTYNVFVEETQQSIIKTSEINFKQEIPTKMIFDLLEKEIYILNNKIKRDKYYLDKLNSEFNFKPMKNLTQKQLEKKCKWSLHLMKHIFGEQYELGLKYLKVIYEKPKQILPILVLVSKERGTGKTTFINWLNIIFGENAIILNPEDMGTSFNSSYAIKNLIIIEESKIKNQAIIEKLKNLATQKKLLVNTKHVQPYSLSFYGKIIITSNDENKFSIVDNEEIRYWVRKISVISKDENENHNIENDLTKEIPYFLAYLNLLPDIDYSKSRMVFLPEEIETSALKDVKKASRSELQKNIEMYLDEFGIANENIKEFKFSAVDLKNMFFRNDNRVSVSYIRKVLKIDMELKLSEKVVKYVPINEIESSNNKKAGRPFSYTNQNFTIEQEEQHFL